MLSKTLDETMEKTMKFENMTRKPVFGRNYYVGDLPVEKKPNMIEKLAPYIKPAQEMANADDDVLNFIVENPDNIAPIFDLRKCEKSDLPFFVSIAKKLNILQIVEE
jgi:hypothetical protein